MKIHQLTLKTGEIIEVRETNDGEWVCPVCGDIAGGEPPYALVTHVNDKPVTPFAAGSFDVCLCCRVEYGCDDWTESTTQAEIWAVLRQKWLHSVNYAPFAVKQLENLQ